MRTQTRHSVQMWIAASRSGKAFALLRLKQLRERSPITAPTSRLFRLLHATITIPPIPGHFVLAAAVLGFIGCLLIVRYH